MVSTATGLTLVASLGVMQHTQVVLSSSLFTRHVLHVHFLAAVANSVLNDGCCGCWSTAFAACCCLVSVRIDVVVCLSIVLAECTLLTRDAGFVGVTESKNTVFSTVRSMLNVLHLVHNEVDCCTPWFLYFFDCCESGHQWHK